MFPGAAERPLVAASSAWRGLCVIASSYQGTQCPICSCPSRRLGREQHVLSEACRRRGSDRRGPPPAAPLRQIPHQDWMRSVPQQKGTQVLLASQSILAQSLSWVLGCYGGSSGPKGILPILTLARQLSLTAICSAPGGWVAPGSSSTCTNYSAFLAALCGPLRSSKCF